MILEVQMREMQDFIPDGYTEDGFIAASAGFHGELRFRFRPCDPIEQGRLLEQSDRIPLDQYRRNLSEVVATKIEWWSLVDKEGTTVQAKPDNLRRLRPALFRRVTAIVLGIEASDEDPRWAEETKRELADTAGQVAATGQQPGTVKAAANSGN